MTIEKVRIEAVEAEEITLADIEELREVLGAEADLAMEADESGVALRSTVMCPSHPWEQ